MKKITLFLVSMFLLVTSSFANNNANVSPNQMINIAGKQRMLSQKIAKIYLLNAYGANLSTLKSELNISKILFERNLETLQENSGKLFSKNVTKAISNESLTWSNFKSIINQPVSDRNVNKVLELSNKLLKDSHAVVVSIKSENFDSSFSTNSVLLDIIDKSGKQRMLSQRLCLYFVAKKFALRNNIKSLRNDTALYSAYKELDEALVDLLTTEVNTMTTEEGVGKTMLTFENIRSQKSDFLDGTASLNIVYGSTNQLTKDFDSLTSKYSDLNTDANGVVSAR